MLGAGASGIQSVTALAQHAEHLTVFQPTPMWILPRFSAAFGEFDFHGRELKILDKCPQARSVLRVQGWRAFSSFFPLALRPDCAVNHQAQLSLSLWGAKCLCLFVCLYVSVFPPLFLSAFCLSLNCALQVKALLTDYMREKVGTDEAKQKLLIPGELTMDFVRR